MITFTDVVGYAGMALSAIGLLLAVWVKRTARELRAEKAKTSVAFVSPPPTVVVSAGVREAVRRAQISGQIYTTVPAVFNGTVGCITMNVSGEIMPWNSVSTPRRARNPAPETAQRQGSYARSITGSIPQTH